MQLHSAVVWQIVRSKIVPATRPMTDWWGAKSTQSKNLHELLNKSTHTKPIMIGRKVVNAVVAKRTTSIRTLNFNIETSKRLFCVLITAQPSDQVGTYGQCGDWWWPVATNLTQHIAKGCVSQYKPGLWWSSEIDNFKKEHNIEIIREKCRLLSLGVMYAKY